MEGSQRILGDTPFKYENGWAFSYFAEIEDFVANESRKFKLFIPGRPAMSKATVDVQENAQKKYTLYEPGYPNISLPLVFSLEFKKTNDSSLGPILNALEIYKYMKINFGSIDANTMSSFASYYPQAEWAHEGGDPCLPASCSWVQCNSNPRPKVISIVLSRKNLAGNILLELTKLTVLVEFHLENNALTSEVPSSLADLPSLNKL